jgi:hypothetical protein
MGKFWEKKFLDYVSGFKHANYSLGNSFQTKIYDILKR